ncbi:hypothetical protein DPEC_G00364780 [Dallia pectoralis]|nr:hypothetical protein DPEC_G00364780 [Dallia pectoralis]
MLPRDDKSRRPGASKRCWQYMCLQSRLGQRASPPVPLAPTELSPGCNPSPFKSAPRFPISARFLCTAGLAETRLVTVAMPQPILSFFQGKKTQGNLSSQLWSSGHGPSCCLDAFPHTPMPEE